MNALPFKPQGELVLTRTFDAPRDLVFKLWTDPKHIPHWWGPTGFVTTVHVMEVRPGGAWRYSMRGPDGKDYPFNGEYVEVVSPEKLVFIGTIHDPTPRTERPSAGACSSTAWRNIWSPFSRLLM